jgi:hypothetical protein
MTSRGRSIALLVIQAVLVLTIAGTYLYERKVCPRVWVRTTQVDPNMPLRGRYLALRLAVDTCDLPKSAADVLPTPHANPQGYRSIPLPPRNWEWTVRTVARDGRLAVEVAPPGTRPELTTRVWFTEGRACERTPLAEPVDYFIADTAKGPFPLRSGEELWVEVTVPPMGPPRPIQLATSGVEGFKVLGLR